MAELADDYWPPKDSGCRSTCRKPRGRRSGGVVATATSGPRRYRPWHDPRLRDRHHAVDGRGVPFKGGGRVVKNVAGYDFCKLLTGSLGTLGVIAQVTLKHQAPAPTLGLWPASSAIGRWPRPVGRHWSHRALRPAAIEIVAGPAWKRLSADWRISRSVALAARWPRRTTTEVTWMIEQFAAEWRADGVARSDTIDAGTGCRHLASADRVSGGAEPTAAAARGDQGQRAAERRRRFCPPGARDRCRLLGSGPRRQRRRYRAICRISGGGDVRGADRPFAAGGRRGRGACHGVIVDSCQRVDAPGGLGPDHGRRRG